MSKPIQGSSENRGMMVAGKGFAVRNQSNPPVAPKTQLVASQMSNVMTPSIVTSSQGSSSRQLTEMQKVALFSPADDLKRREAADKMLASLVTRMKETQSKIDASLNDFYQESRAMNKRLVGSAHKFLDLVEKLSEKGEIVQQHHTQILDYTVQCSQTIRTECAATFEQLHKFEENIAKVDMVKFGKYIEVAFDARMKELQYMSEKLKVLREQEKFEIESDIKLREQAMKERAQNFDQLIRIVEKMNESEQQEFEMYLKAHEMEFKQMIDLQKLSLEEQKVLGELNLQKEKNQADERLAKEKMTQEARVEHHRIAAHMTSELTKEAIKLAKPSCDIV